MEKISKLDKAYRVSSPIINNQPRKNNPSFGGTVGHFSLKMLTDLPCPYCGFKMIPSGKVRIDLKEQLSTTTGKELQEVLLNTFFQQKPLAERTIAVKMAEKAPAHPDKNIKDVLDLLFDESQDAMTAGQDLTIQRIYGFIGMLSEDLGKRTRQALRNTVRACKELTVADSIYEKNQRFGHLTGMLYRNSGIGDAKGIARIVNTIKGARTKVEDFIFTYRGEKPRRIANQLMEPFVASGEHVLPEATAGLAEAHNLLVAHIDCNTFRDITPLDKYIEKYPEVASKMYEHIDAVREQIQATPINGFENYVKNITETLHRESKGILAWSEFGQKTTATAQKVGSLILYPYP